VLRSAGRFNALEQRVAAAGVAGKHITGQILPVDGGVSAIMP
jgi:hypothetical protein